MNKSMTMMIAAVAVVAVVVASAAVVLVVNGSGTKELPKEAGEYGTVYGNADGNCYINSDDKELMQAIIDGNRSLEDFPLADMNVDGVVDQKDLDMIDKFIAHEAMTIYVLDTYGDHIAVEYPVTMYATEGGNNLRSVIAVLGIEEGMLANGTTSYTSEILDKKLYDLKADGTIATLTSSITDADITTLINLKTRILIAEDYGMGPGDATRTTIEEAGIVYLELNAKNTALVCQTLTTLGIMFGKEAKAEAYINWSNSIYKTIKDNIGDAFGTKTVLTVTMSNSVSGTASDYYAASQESGGKNIADWEAKTKKFNPASGDTWLLDEKYNADYIFHFRSLAFPKELTPADISTYEAYFNVTDTYKNGGYYLINGVLPLPIRAALMAEIMYGECFSENWAQSVFQEYIDNFLDGVTFDVSSVQFYWHGE